MSFPSSLLIVLFRVVSSPGLVVVAEAVLRLPFLVLVLAAVPLLVFLTLVVVVLLFVLGSAAARSVLSLLLLVAAFCWSS